MANFNDTAVKKLPRDNDGNISKFFTANGKEYKITHFDNGVPIERYMAYERLSLGFAYDASFQTMHDNLEDIGKLLNRILAGDSTANVGMVWAALSSMKDGLKSVKGSRFNRAMYVCTIFIIEEGEDVSTWDSSIAERKIENWSKEGYGVQDFFYLAIGSIQGLNDALKKSMEVG